MVSISQCEANQTKQPSHHHQLTRSRSARAVFTQLVQRLIAGVGARRRKTTASTAARIKSQSVWVSWRVSHNKSTSKNVNPPQLEFIISNYQIFIPICLKPQSASESGQPSPCTGLDGYPQFELGFLGRFTAAEGAPVHNCIVGPCAVVDLQQKFAGFGSSAPCNGWTFKKIIFVLLVSTKKCPIKQSLVHLPNACVWPSVLQNAQNLATHTHTHGADDKSIRIIISIISSYYELW